MSHTGHHNSIKSPLGKARGLGASHTGVQAWISLRVTAIAQAILAIWFFCFLTSAIHASHEEFLALVAQPLNAIALVLFVLSGFYHAGLGAREIIEDYIHCECLKIAKLIGIYLFFFAAGAACVFSILKIALM